MTTAPIKPIILDLLRAGHDNEAAWEEKLTEAEREAIGTPRLWSARDHLVHRNFGRQNLIQVLRAILQQQEAPPREKINDEVNGAVFAEQRLRPWSELHAESEQIYADLITLIEQLSEDDLMDTPLHRRCSCGETHVCRLPGLLVRARPGAYRAVL